MTPLPVDTSSRLSQTCDSEESCVNAALSLRYCTATIVCPEQAAAFKAATESEDQARNNFMSLLSLREGGGY